MLLTSVACPGSHAAKLSSCWIGTLLRSTSRLHAPHCCTASLHALQTCAAAHNTLGFELRDGCSRAMIRTVLSTAYDDNSQQAAHGCSSEPTTGTSRSCCMQCCIQVLSVSRGLTVRRRNIICRVTLCMTVALLIRQRCCGCGGSRSADRQLWNRSVAIFISQGLVYILTKPQIFSRVGDTDEVPKAARQGEHAGSCSVLEYW